MHIATRVAKVDAFFLAHITLFLSNDLLVFNCRVPFVIFFSVERRYSLFSAHQLQIVF